jgi:chromosome segregation ATPase
MNSLDAFEKRLRDETATVEKEIESHQQQLETLNQRLQGLRRAAELFESEQGAISELLQAGTANGGVTRGMPVLPAAKAQKAKTTPESNAAKRRHAAEAQRRSNASTGKGRGSPSHNGGLTRVDMMAAVLKRHPRQTVRELIALLDKEYRWKTNESAVTGLLYTRRDKFVHIPPDRAANRPVTWSSK